jgi:hypothetical protein
MRSLDRVALSAAFLAAALLFVRATARAPGASPSSAARPGAAPSVRRETGRTDAGAPARLRAAARAAPAAAAPESAAAGTPPSTAATPQSDVPRHETLRPDEARDSAPPSGGAPLPPAIELDPLVLGEVTARVSGFDPLAPRPLWLWRRVGSREAVMARGRSREDGRLAFPDLVVPDEGLEVLITAAEGAPGNPGASLPRSVAAREPLPPRARVLAREREGWTLRIVPAEPSGEILLAGPDGAVFARRAPPPHPVAPGGVFDLVLSLLPGDTEVWLAHERADGRRSAWTRVELWLAGPEEIR